MGKHRVCIKPTSLHAILELVEETFPEALCPKRPVWDPSRVQGSGPLLGTQKPPTTQNPLPRNPERDLKNLQDLSRPPDDASPEVLAPSPQPQEQWKRGLPSFELLVLERSVKDSFNPKALRTHIL